MTAEHLQPILENCRDAAALVSFATALAQGEIPQEALDGIRIGFITALSEPEACVRGIVVGDIFRRFVAKNISKQVLKEAKKATAPYQYALCTRAGCECVAHILQSSTELCENATIVSVDGICADDNISRRAMLQGVLRMPSGDRIPPFLKQFYSFPSTYIWEDDMGTQHEVTQGEKGEQGDPLMPMLFCLGQHGAFAAVESRLKAGEKLFAFLDDIYLICQPDRVQDVHRILEEELRTRVGIRVHHGKTQIWNKSGCTPRGVDVMTKIARGTVKDAVLWRGDQNLPVGEQGIGKLGVPIGQEEYIKNHLAKKSDEHQVLMNRIPFVQDPQTAWLLLFYCAGSRATFWLLSVRLQFSADFADANDKQMWEFFN